MPNVVWSNNQCSCFFKAYIFDTRFLVYYTHSEITGLGEVGATASSNEIFDGKVGGIGEGEETVTSLRNNEGEFLVAGIDEGVGLIGVA